MYKNLVNAMYILNILWQALFTLAFPMLLGFGASWLAVESFGAPSWIYAVLLTLGTLAGFYNMIKFVISAMDAYDRLEKSREKRKNTKDTGNTNE